MKWSDVIYKIKNGEEYKFSEGNHQVDKIKEEEKAEGEKKAC
jgi:hypothetical protein